MKHPEHVAVSRAPNGCSASVQAQVTPEERAQIRALAFAESRSMGATARLLIIEALRARANGSCSAN